MIPPRHGLLCRPLSHTTTCKPETLRVRDSPQPPGRKAEREKGREGEREGGRKEGRKEREGREGKGREGKEGREMDSSPICQMRNAKLRKEATCSRSKS